MSIVYSTRFYRIAQGRMPSVLWLSLSTITPFSLWSSPYPFTLTPLALYLTNHSSKNPCTKSSQTSSFAGSATCSITTALGALRQILFADVSPPATLLGCSLCLDILSFSKDFFVLSYNILVIWKYRQVSQKGARLAEVLFLFPFPLLFPFLPCSGSTRKRMWLSRSNCTIFLL